jgi:hypothetical protein
LRNVRDRFFLITEPRWVERGVKLVEQQVRDAPVDGLSEWLPGHLECHGVPEVREDAVSFPTGEPSQRRDTVVCVQLMREVCGLRENAVGIIGAVEVYPS